MVEPTEPMPTVPSVSLLPVLPAEIVNTILTALMSAEGALDLVYQRTSIETYGHALAQVRVALNEFADLLA
jgi:spore maturation protein SpmB